MTTRTIAVVSAGLSTPSATRLLADRLADATSAALRERGDDAVVEVIELREHAHDLTNNLLTSFASEPLQAAKDTVAGADALIAVSPIFSTSYTGLFKMFFDLLDEDALADTPVLIGATAGTARHSLALDYALRPLFTYLRAVVVPTGVFAASDDWGSGGDADGGLTGRIERAAAQLADLARARPEQAATDPFEDPVPFEQLLRDSTG
ncbi:MAG: FMN reductase [Actinomycetota bacterium]